MIETSAAVRRHTMSTSHGVIAVEERGEHGLPVLFIHGNSSCSAVFDAQLSSPLAAEHRLIAIDLSGHGESSDALDPIRSEHTRGQRSQQPRARFLSSSLCDVDAAREVARSTSPEQTVSA